MGPYVPLCTKRISIPVVDVRREIFCVPLILTRVSSFGTCLTTLSRSSSVKVTRTQFSSSVGRGSFPSLVTQECSYNMVKSYQYYYKNDLNLSVIKIKLYIIYTTMYRILKIIGVSGAVIFIFTNITIKILNVLIKKEVNQNLIT